MRRIIREVRYVRDRVEELGDGAWQGVPVPPDDDPAWRIFDTKPDRKTGWIRFHVCEGSA
jgi:hypothetical protein